MRWRVNNSICEGVDMDIRLENGININNSLLLCDWSNEKGERFQKQWMGTRISYPLDIDKIQKMDNVFSIFNEEEFIGIIQIIRFENNNAHIGRFIVNPQKTGQGFGKVAMKKFLKFLFSDKNIESVTLTVFASNKYVINMYEKLGFKIDEVLKTPELKYIMKKSR